MPKDYKCDHDSDAEDVDGKTRRQNFKRLGLFWKASDRGKLVLAHPWPHVCLKLEYSSTDIRFNDFTVPMFVTGELEIIRKCMIEAEKLSRIEFLNTMI